jgi:hypothetical protein
VSFTIGSYSVDPPRSIEESVSDGLAEYDKVAGVRGIAARTGYSKGYKLQWTVFDTSTLATFESAVAQAMPVTISDTAGLFSLTGFVLDYKVKTIMDVTPFYEVSMTLETDKLT